MEIRIHDELPPEATAIDAGIGAANDAAAPLHEVRPLACIAHGATGQVLGGAVGRRWGGCCELQQLWVDAAQRRLGVGSQLMQAFEAAARAHGCTQVFLETFSFQAPQFYRRRGYLVAWEQTGYPHGIVRLHLHKAL